MNIFTAEQRAAFLAAADRIIPEDDFPSASQAGAERYVLQLLATDLRDRAAAFLAGLDWLNADGRRFAALSTAEQDAVLARLESHLSAEVRDFFRLLVDLVNEGYYADPANGGNRGALSWKMIGFDPRVPGDLTETGTA